LRLYKEKFGRPKWGLRLARIYDFGRGRVTKKNSLGRGQG